MSPKPCTYC